MATIINPFYEAERLVAERGDWVVGAIETHVPWPMQKQAISYEDKVFILLPLGEPNPRFDNARTLPAISLRADKYGLDHDQARREIMRFASALAWREQAKIEILEWTGGLSPRSIGIMRNNIVSDYMCPENLPSVIDDKAATALAFYREGVSLDNPFYAFLSFYKAFSVAIQNGSDRGTWISSNLRKIYFPRAKERLVELDNQGITVGTYLFEQGRNAIAHADREPFINPDNADDYYRLSLDLPLMHNFAVLAIKERFNSFLRV